MAAEPNAVEQAVSRTLRDNLGRIQRASEELRQAINDLVSACASSRPTNVLPPMIRAQASAASLSASLEVLSRFVTAALQPALRSPFEQEILRVASAVAAEDPFERIPADPQGGPGRSPDQRSGMNATPSDCGATAPRASRAERNTSTRIVVR